MSLPDTGWNAERAIALSIPVPELAQRVLRAVEGSSPSQSRWDTVERAVRGVVAELTDDDVIGLVPAFYGFAPDDELPPHELRFARESNVRSSPALDREALTEAERGYRERFGFKPVVFVNGHNARAVADVLLRAIASDRVTEIPRVRDAMVDIFTSRIRTIADRISEAD